MREVTPVPAVPDGAGPVGELVAAVKPRLRGWLHAGMFPLALAAGSTLVRVGSALFGPRS